MAALARRLYWDCLRNISRKLETNSFDVRWKNGEIEKIHLTLTLRNSGKCFFIKLLSFFTMLFVEAQLRTVRKSPVVPCEDPTELVQHLRRNACFPVYATLVLEREGMMSKFHKSQSKVIDRRPNWRKKIQKKNDKTLTNKHFILKIVSRLTTLCLNNTWYFGWGTPSFTIFDSYLICWLHWEKKYIMPARSLVEISESAYRVYRS